MSGTRSQPNTWHIGVSDLAKRMVVPVARWCTSCLDRDNRRHDRRRPTRFWGDME